MKRTFPRKRKIQSSKFISTGKKYTSDNINQDQIVHGHNCDGGCMGKQLVARKDYRAQYL